MVKKSLFDSVLDNKLLKTIKSVPEETDDSDIDHLRMAEDEKNNKNKKKLAAKKDPRIDTGILRNRIADKIAKLTNY